MFVVCVISTGTMRKVHVLSSEMQFHTEIGKSHSNCLKNSLRSHARALQVKIESFRF